MKKGEFDSDTSEFDVCKQKYQSKRIPFFVVAVCDCIVFLPSISAAIMAYFENRSLLKSERSHAKPQDIPSTSSDEWSSSYSSDSSVSRSYR